LLRAKKNGEVIESHLTVSTEARLILEIVDGIGKTGKTERPRGSKAVDRSKRARPPSYEGWSR